MFTGKKPLYKRVLLKFSGEALAGENSFGISPVILNRFATEVSKVISQGIELGIVVGGGNLFRGKDLHKAGIDRITGDHMGMLATIMNAIAFRDAIVSQGVEATVMSSFAVSGMAEQFDRNKAKQYLHSGQVVIFSGGTGNPLVTNDSAASLRAIEIEADILLKATNVDGVYDSDPSINKNAKLFDKISFKQALHQELGVMDLGAFLQCRNHAMDIRVFNLNKENAVVNIMFDPKEGTLVTHEE